MKQVFSSQDFGALVFGRQALLADQKAQLSIWLGVTPPETAVSEITLWARSLTQIIANKTRFGRIAVVFDRKNEVMQSFRTNFNTADLEYKPQKKTGRPGPEKIPRILWHEMQILREMANEQLADTVEFRRLARKQLRAVKQANIDTVFFAEAIFGQEKTRQILEHLAGTQLQLFFPTDCVTFPSHQATARQIQIHTHDQSAWFQKTAEKILRTKLSAQDFVVVEKE